MKPGHKSNPLKISGPCIYGRWRSQQSCNDVKINLEFGGKLVDGRTDGWTGGRLGEPGKVWPRLPDDRLMPRSQCNYLVVKRAVLVPSDGLLNCLQRQVQNMKEKNSHQLDCSVRNCKLNRLPVDSLLQKSWYNRNELKNLEPVEDNKKFYKNSNSHGVVVKSSNGFGHQKPDQPEHQLCSVLDSGSLAPLRFIFFALDKFSALT